MNLFSKAGVVMLMASVIAIGLGVLFSIVYPDVEISAGIATLFVLISVLFSMATVSLFEHWRER